MRYATFTMQCMNLDRVPKSLEDPLLVTMKNEQKIFSESWPKKTVQAVLGFFPYNPQNQIPNWDTLLPLLGAWSITPIVDIPAMMRLPLMADDTIHLERQLLSLSV